MRKKIKKTIEKGEHRYNMETKWKFTVYFVHTCYYQRLSITES